MVPAPTDQQIPTPVWGVLRKRFGRLHSSLLIPAAALLIGIGVLAFNPVGLQVLRNFTFDQFQRLQPRVYQDAPVRIIDIDDASLQRLGQWPWPRTRLAELTTRMQQAQPAAIAYDFLWSEPERANSRDAAADGDVALANAFAQGRVVIGLALQRELDSTTPPIPYTKSRFFFSGAPPLPLLHTFGGSVDALDALVKAASGYGALTFIPDNDGVIRRVPLLLRRGTELVPSLAAEALRVAAQTANYGVRTSGSNGATIRDIRIGKRIITTTANGEVWVHYSRHQPQRTIPAWKVLAGIVPASQLQGRILMVGTSAQGLMDTRFSPLGGVIPGVEIHAQLIEQVLGGEGLTRPSWSTGAEAVTMAVAGVLVGLGGLLTSALASLIFALIITSAIWCAAWLAFSHAGLLLDPAIITLVVTTTYVAASIVRHVVSEQRQRWIKAAFSKYISPNVVNYLMRHPEFLELSGRAQECSFVFTDLAGFTTMLERMEPTAAIALLNGYLDQMISITFAHQGTLDRIVGDAVAIMFSAPVPQADHQSRALECALALQRFSLSYVGDLKARGIDFGRTRIGIHSGVAIVGNFGNSTMFDFRALGDVVNTTARLEGANKHLGTFICASAATMQGCGDMPARPIGRVLLQGKQIPLQIFEPLDPRLSTQNDTEYGHAFTLMAAGDPQAIAAFAQLHAARPDDMLVSMHLQRLQTPGAEINDLIVLSAK